MRLKRVQTVFAGVASALRGLKVSCRPGFGQIFGNLTENSLRLTTKPKRRFLMPPIVSAFPRPARSSPSPFVDADSKPASPAARYGCRLGERIRWLREARDSAAANGKRRRLSPFTTYEAMEAHHVADAVLRRALWFTAESLGRKGDVTEISFLLGAILAVSPNWVTDKISSRQERSRSCSRAGGLARVFRSASLARRSFAAISLVVFLTFVKRSNMYWMLWTSTFGRAREKLCPSQGSSARRL